MASALDHLETLEKANKYFSGAKELVDSTKKINGIAKSTPHDLSGAKKVLGMTKNEYIPLSKFLVSTQKTVNATVAAGFPEIMNPALDARKRMEKIAKASGSNTTGFEKELTAYIKQAKKYELLLRERISYMKIVQKKCELNIKNFTLIDRTIRSTVLALETLVASVPSARNEAGKHLLDILSTGIEKQSQPVVAAYNKLLKAAAAHEKMISREHTYAKARLTNAQDKKLKFVMEDAKEFFRKLF